MKVYNIIILILTSAFFLYGCNAKEQHTHDNDSQSNKDLYYGLKPPGLVSEPLELIDFSKENWKLGEIHDSNMEEFYLSSSEINVPFRPMVISFRKEKNTWKKYDFYYTGGNTLYSNDKYIERTETGWSKIKNLGVPFNSIFIMRLTASSKGTLVFDEASRDGNGVLRYSRLIDGKREVPKPLSKEINTGKWSAHPFIAYDESYIIWDSEKEGGYGDSDLYISFRQKNGSWGKAINMGDKINTKGEDGGGYVTPDGKYFSYCPNCKPPYNRKWIDAKIIEELRQKQN